ncbi:MAG TPA: N-acetylmuramic acid 6-phosphate etherase [bacterium]|nr:N-acetylmuramic acid 6-phosphate etherase [bacterium]
MEITEQPGPATAALDRLSTEEIVALINTEDAAVAAAVRTALPEIARTVDLIADRLRHGGRLIYVGAGTSGRIGLLDAAEWGPAFGTPLRTVRALLAGSVGASVEVAASVEGETDAGAADLRAREVTAADVVLGISAGGRTPYVIGALQTARELGAATVSIVCDSGAPVSHLSDIAVVAVTGPEVLAGATRMKAGTAQKMILNMISTAVNVRLGKVFGNIMVDIQPLNEKQLARAGRVVADAAGVSEDEAARLLEAAGGSVKAAIVMAETGVDLPEARRRLERAGGFVRAAIQGT